MLSGTGKRSARDSSVPLRILANGNPGHPVGVRVGRPSRGSEDIASTSRISRRKGCRGASRARGLAAAGEATAK